MITLEAGKVSLYSKGMPDLIFNQTTNLLTDSGGRNLCKCYSGKPGVRDQTIKDRGPVPEGGYTMDAPLDTKTHGPAVIWLEPDPTNKMFGRNAFGMHSDSILEPGWASEGCIVNTIVDPDVAMQVTAGAQKWAKTSTFREWLWKQGYRRLVVVTGRLLT